jgi:hypothetical protein
LIVGNGRAVVAMRLSIAILEDRERLRSKSSHLSSTGGKSRIVRAQPQEASDDIKRNFNSSVGG